MSIEKSENAFGNLLADPFSPSFENVSRKVASKMAKEESWRSFWNIFRD